jgi:pyruvate formate lyase activating enzyme
MAACASCAGVDVLAGPAGKLARVEARYYTKLDGKKVQCELCPWRCIVEPGRRGKCNVRENRNGKYISLVYGKIASHHNDNIEKKPFYHLLPGTMSFSVATAGCNVTCKFCQNWELAQRRPEDLRPVDFTPVEVVKYAKANGSASIAFTYNEPTIYTEFIVDTAKLAQEAGIKCVMISNGFINKAPLTDLCGVIDGYKVDLKSFSGDYYRDVVGGRLGPVLETLRTLKKKNVWTEIVYLTVPTLNDNESEVREMARWIHNNLGSEVPVHFSRFYPRYRLRNLPPTPIATLEKLRNISLDEGLKFVYLGNVPGHTGENTVCPSCGRLLLRRVGYTIYENHLKSGKCGFCNTVISGLWN